MGRGIRLKMLLSDVGDGFAETVAAELRDYPEWHRGRARYGVWIVPVNEPALLDYIETVRLRLADLLHPVGERQPHLTVFVCGFEQAERVLNDDFSPAQLQAQIASLRKVSGEPCVLPLMPPDSFATAAFIPVGDPQGSLVMWRRALAADAREVRQAAYIPHITLGLYRKGVVAPYLRERLQAIEAPPRPLRVRCLRYVTYDARRQLGPLQSQYELALGGPGSWTDRRLPAAQSRSVQGKS